MFLPVQQEVASVPLEIVSAAPLINAFVAAPSVFADRGAFGAASLQLLAADYWDRLGWHGYLPWKHWEAEHSHQGQEQKQECGQH